MNARVIKQTPHRLDRIYQQYDSPLYFITFNTWQRKRTLAHTAIHHAFLDYAARNAEAGRCIGCFVIMPDHVHCFARLGDRTRLSDFVRLLKQHLGKALKARGESPPYWQPGFFDHLMRNSEGYTEKWQYVRDNPVRAGLVAKSEDWLYQGEVVRIDRV